LGFTHRNLRRPKLAQALKRKHQESRPPAAASGQLGSGAMSFQTDITSGEALKREVLEVPGTLQGDPFL
jgi:hypothetical protein